MIDIIDQINKIFAAETSDSNFNEDTTCFSATLSGESLCMPDEEAFDGFVHRRDWFSIIIIDEFGECVDTYVSNTKTTTYTEFKNECRLQSGYTIKLEIQKSRADQYLSIYNLALFKTYIFNLELQGLAFTFDSLVKTKESKFILDCLNDDICVGSNLLIFASPGNNVNIGMQISKTRRNDLTNKRKSVTHSDQQYDFIPDDFLLIFRDEKHSEIEGLYNQLATICAAQFIFDSLDIKSQIDYKLNGYKSISTSLALNTVSNLYSDANRYVQIYQWIYNEGNLIDKIGLARNIISLNIDRSNLHIEDRTFEAIKSSYKIYQTQNIKQYIEVRNKISDQLYDIYNKADKITDNFIGNFKKSIFTLISFLISVVAIRVISKGDFVGGFNKDVTILTFGLLLISLAVMFYNRWEITVQINRYQNFYTNLKIRYLDLLDSSDINRILNNDKDFNDSVDFIKSKRKYYTIVWVVSIIVLFIASISIYCFNILNSKTGYIIIKKITQCFIENT